MALSESPVPKGIERHISLGRYREAASALANLLERQPSAPILIAHASVGLILGDLTAAKASALKVVEADPQRHEARFLLARIRAALDERDAAIADFRAALDLHLKSNTASPTSSSIPAHLALHTLEQLAYIEAEQALAQGTLLPVTGLRLDETRRQIARTLASAGVIVPAVALSADLTRALAQPPLLIHDEPPPETCLTSRNDWSAAARDFADSGGVTCVDDLLSPIALAQLQRFCLQTTAWRQPNRHGYIGGLAEHGFFSKLILQIAAELKAAIPELLADHHMTYWWGFVYQHQRPGTDIHADQSDISLNMWLTPDAANLEPGTGGLDIWDADPPANWTFADYNSGGSYAIRAHLTSSEAKKRSFAYRENRALLFKGSLFHQTATCRFAEGFANRRRNITMLFRRTKPFAAGRQAA